MAEVDRTEWMAALAEDASYFRPRLFAIYGVQRALKGFWPEHPFLGWGMDHGDGKGAIFREDDDRSIHTADSAEQLLIGFKTHAEAELVWLEDD
ncbi:MAG TPA: hypothetical protein VHX38_40585 [Pseudonocardiaceae bacterium]|jgi:hypothetical protein|nr:hypothetical protein [Pseudonocardiaceae bacterium]